MDIMLIIIMLHSYNNVMLEKIYNKYSYRNLKLIIMNTYSYPEST